MDDHDLLKKLESKVTYIETNYVSRQSLQVTEQVTQKIIDKLVGDINKTFEKKDEKIKMLEDRIIDLDETIKELRWNMRRHGMHIPCEICTKYAEHWKSP
jgi:hypothetical protein